MSRCPDLQVPPERHSPRPLHGSGAPGHRGGSSQFGPLQPPPQNRNAHTLDKTHQIAFERAASLHEFVTELFNSIATLAILSISPHAHCPSCPHSPCRPQSCNDFLKSHAVTGSHSFPEAKLARQTNEPSLSRYLIYDHRESLIQEQSVFMSRNLRLVA